MVFETHVTPRIRSCEVDGALLLCGGTQSYPTCAQHDAEGKAELCSAPAARRCGRLLYVSRAPTEARRARPPGVRDGSRQVKPWMVVDGPGASAVTRPPTPPKPSHQLSRLT